MPSYKGGIGPQRYAMKVLKAFGRAEVSGCNSFLREIQMLMAFGAEEEGGRPVQSVITKSGSTR